MKLKVPSQLHRVTSIRQEQKSRVIRDVHYSEYSVEEKGLKRKKQVALTWRQHKGIC